MVNNNNFFILNNYFIYIYPLDDEYKYTFFKNKENYYLYIKNKKNKRENITFKIMKNNQEYIYHILKESNNLLKLKNFENLPFIFNNQNNQKIDNLNNISIDLNIDEIILKQYINFNIDYYKNNLFENLELEFNSKEKLEKYLKYNWYYFGSQNKIQYFKYIIYKNDTLIDKLNYTKLKYDNYKNKTLIFIDDRYDILFKLILILFLYGVDESWNLTIFTTKENESNFQNILNALDVEAKFNYINKIVNVQQYSNLLKSSSFWDNIQEEHLLFFQYDSVCFGKFQDKFLEYNYLGAKWPKNITQLPNIYNGNGGTSYRKKSVMSYITTKYNYYLYDTHLPEDVYFAKYLKKEGLNIYNDAILEDFSFENTYSEKSIYGHAIFQSIELKKLEEYIIMRIKKML
jgi:hypothetical protein